MSAYGDPRLPDNFWARVEVQESGCWRWTGAMAVNGYGFFWWGRRQNRAHRVAYVALVGPIPTDLPVLDHLCHHSECLLGDQCPHRACVNPAHLEPVTFAENSARGNTAAVLRALNLAKTTCPHGHELTEENVFRWSGGARRCRTCEDSRMARRRLARQGSVA